MLTPSLSLVSVFLVLLLGLLITLAPVDVLAGIAPPSAAASSALDAAASSGNFNSSSTARADVLSKNVSSSSSSSSSFSSSSLLFSSSSVAQSGKLETRERERTASAYDTKDFVVMGPVEDILNGPSESHVEGERSPASRDGVETAAHSGAAIARPLALQSNSLLSRERRSSDTRDPNGSSSNPNSAKSNNINSKSDNNTTDIRSSSSKKRHENGKSPKKDRGRTPLWSEEYQLGCHELRARRYISDGFCTSNKPILEVVCTGHCLPIKEIDWYAEFVKTMARSKVREWQCVEDYVKKKRVRLLCRNGDARFYWINVVKSCKCEKVSNSNSTYSRRRNRKKRKKRKKGRNNRRGRGS